VFPHIKDLEERSVEGLNVNQSITHLVTAAENSLRQAVTLLEYRKPDLAYVEYLRCYEILVNFVCSNPGYPDFKASRGPTYSRYSYLVKVGYSAIILILANDDYLATQNSR